MSENSFFRLRYKTLHADSSIKKWVSFSPRPYIKHVITISDVLSQGKLATDALKSHTEHRRKLYVTLHDYFNAKVGELAATYNDIR